MKNIFLKVLLTIIIISSYLPYINGKDPVDFSLSTNFYKDLSDTYGKGNLFFGDFSISRTWYGVDLGFGYYQGQSTFIYQAFIEETNQSLEIPFEELTIMNMGSVSGLIKPIQNDWIEIDLIFGAVLCKAKSLLFQSVDFKYSFIDNTFIYLYKDFQLVENNHFGYQVGLNISFYTIKKMGIQINARVQDLSNGGTFFLIGGGLCFKI